MKSRVFFVVLSVSLLVNCRSVSRYENKGDGIQYKESMEVSYREASDSKYQVSLESDTISKLTNGDYEKFKSRKNGIDIQAMINSRSAKMKIERGSVDMTGQIRKFSKLARMGNKEVEGWLLNFYDEYFDALFSWNKTCDHCDGVGGIPHMFMLRFNKSLYRGIRNIPPSMEKIDLIMRLYKKESDTYWAEGDHDDIINGDKIVLNLLCPNIDDERCLRRGDIGRYNDDAINEVQETIEQLYNQIKMGEVKLIDRETWKSM